MTDPAPTLDPAAAYFAAVGNFVGTWRAIAEVLPGGKTAEILDGQALLVSTGLPVAMFNQAFVLDEADPDADAIVREAVAFYRDAGVPFSLRFPAFLGDDFDAVAPAHGMEPAGRSPLMVMDPIRPSPPLPASATARRAVGQPGLAEHRDLAARGFGAPVSLMEQFLPDVLVQHDFFAAVIVDCEDVPASTAAFVDASGIAGIYDVATPEEFRCRGLGEAATWAALEIGTERGRTVATLQASEMGMPIYERMGFRTVAWWRSLTG